MRSARVPWGTSSRVMSPFRNAASNFLFLWWFKKLIVGLLIGLWRENGLPSRIRSNEFPKLSGIQ